MEYLSGKRRGFTDKLLQINNLSVKRLGFPDTCHLDFRDTRHLNFPDASYLTKQPKSGTTFIRKKAGFSGQTRGRVFQTDADCGLTDKRGLRFTDRRSSDFPDTRHLDFPDTRCLNFPDASYLTKQPKSGITNSAQKTSAQKNGVIYRQVGG